MKIKNWSKFQHFKDRRPPWIKLHRELLDQRDINVMSDRCFRVLINLWLLASEDPELNGNLPSISDISWRTRISEKDITKAIQELGDFVDHSDIKLISERYQVGPPEKRRGETETETEEKALPSWLDHEAWSDYTQHRKERSKPLTKLATAMAINKLKGLTDDGFTQRQIINHTISNGWLGLFSPEKPKRRIGELANERLQQALKGSGSESDIDDRQHVPLFAIVKETERG